MNDGGPAFPRPQVGMGNNWGETEASVPGMSLRDYFAGQVLAGLMSDPNTIPGEKNWPDDNEEFKADVAFSAYSYADAMLAERSKQS